MANLANSDFFMKELTEKAGTDAPANLAYKSTDESFAVLDPKTFYASSLGSHDLILQNIQDEKERIQASKAKMSETKSYFEEFLADKKSKAVKLDKLNLELAVELDAEQYLTNMERVLSDNSNRTQVANCLKAVEIMRRSIVEGNECKKSMKKISAAKTRRFLTDMDLQPKEPANKGRTELEETPAMIHFVSEEMRKITNKFAQFESEVRTINEKLLATGKAQTGLIEYIKKVDVVVSSQIMTEVYRRQKFAVLEKEYLKYYAQWTEKESKLRDQFTATFRCENIPSVFGQLLIDAAQYDNTAEVLKDPEFIEHKNIWKAFLDAQTKYYKESWVEEYRTIKENTNFSRLEDRIKGLERDLRQTELERDQARESAAEKATAIENLRNQIRDGMKQFEQTKLTLDTEKAGAEELAGEVTRLMQLNHSQASLIQTLTEERDSLRATLAKEKEENIRAVAQLKEDQAKATASLKEENRGLRLEVDAVTEMSISKTEIERRLTKEVTQLKSALESVQSEKALISNRVEELDNSLSELSGKYNKLEMTYTVKCEAYDRLKAKTEQAPS